MRAAIHLDKLGKKYRLAPGLTAGGYRTLREALVEAATAPFRRLRAGLSRADAAAEDFWALRDASFEVKPGEVVGIIGRNGAGKSTLLKILSRITKPTTGRVEINGRVGSLLEVGTGFHPELSGRENIYLNGSILGMSKKEIDRRFDQIVAFAEVERFLDMPVKRYSSGMYVRLAFAVAAHLEPEILIIDEVLAVGDAEFQRRCLDKMSAVGRSGRTILFVSHNMAAVENLCSKCYLIAEGRIVASGPVHPIIAEYQKRRRVATGAVIDLAGHPNRRGDISPRLRRLSISSAGQPTASIRMGDALEFTLEYDCGHRPVDLRLGITLEDHRGVQVVSFSPTCQAPGLLRNSPSAGSARCAVPGVPLVEGRYVVHVFYDDGRGSESVEAAGEVEILPTDVFGTGRVPEPRHGVVYMPCQWSLTDQNG
jgi:lipopolysaccharide transport system ATP-binding protein